MYYEVVLHCDRCQLDHEATRIQVSFSHLKLMVLCTNCHRVIEREVEFSRIQRECMKTDGKSITYAAYPDVDTIVK